MNLKEKEPTLAIEPTAGERNECRVNCKYITLLYTNMSISYVVESRIIFNTKYNIYRTPYISK